MSEEASVLITEDEETCEAVEDEYEDTDEDEDEYENEREDEDECQGDRHSLESDRLRSSARPRSENRQRSTIQMERQ